MYHTLKSAKLCDAEDRRQVQPLQQEAGLQFCGGHRQQHPPLGGRAGVPRQEAHGQEGQVVSQENEPVTSLTWL